MTTRRSFRGHVELRQKGAKERQAYWANLSPEKQLAQLDFRLGEGEGAKKQRARIAAQITKRDSPEAVVPKEDSGARKRKQRRQSRKDKK